MIVPGVVLLIVGLYFAALADHLFDVLAALAVAAFGLSMVMTGSVGPHPWVRP